MAEFHVDHHICAGCGNCYHSMRTGTKEQKEYFAGLPDSAIHGLEIPQWVLEEAIDRCLEKCFLGAMTVR